MTRKQPKPIKTTSKKTGAVILLLVTLFVVISISWYYFAYNEAERLEQQANEWRQQPCKEMIKDNMLDPQNWKTNAIIDKGC